MAAHQISELRAQGGCCLYYLTCSTFSNEYFTFSGCWISFSQQIVYFQNISVGIKTLTTVKDEYVEHITVPWRNMHCNTYDISFTV